MTAPPADDQDPRAPLVNVVAARDHMHRTTGSSLAPVLLTFGALAHAPTIRSAIDPDAPYRTRRQQAAAAVSAAAADTGSLTSWETVVTDAHRAAVVGGVYAAAHLVSAGSIPVTPADVGPTTAVFNPAPWIRAQQTGMGGDLAALLTGPAADDVTDGDISVVLAAGAGALYYLDVQTGWAWLTGSALQYRGFGTRSVDWITAGDGVVCAACQRYADQSPWPVGRVPEPPHGGCRCWIVPH